MLNHFRLLAPLYDRLIPPPDPARLVELLRLPMEGRLLDAGGGTGRVAEGLRPMVGELVISDETTAMLRQAQAKGLQRAVASHVERLPFPDRSFDRVLVVDALHHFADQRQAVAELVRVLRPGGRLVIEEPDLNRFPVRLVALGEKAALMRSHFLYPHEIGRLLAAHGLQPQIVADGRFATWVVGDR